jgi:hypothetical protein
MIEILAPVATALGVTAMLCLTAHRAWRGWLDLKRLELARAHSVDEGDAETGLRIELADVRERLRKLEAIANGVEL